MARRLSPVTGCHKGRPRAARVGWNRVTSAPQRRRGFCLSRLARENTSTRTSTGGRGAQRAAAGGCEPRQQRAPNTQADLRVELDASNDRVANKIRRAEQGTRPPYILVGGKREAAAGALAVRVRGEGDQGAQPLERFLARV